MKIHNTIIIKKNNLNYYLFLADKNGEDIFIKGKVARLELPKSQPIIHTLNDQIGTLQFAPSKKELRFNITRYAGENNTYKMTEEQTGIMAGSHFGYWKVEGIWDQHLNYLLEIIYYNFKKDIINKIKEEKNNCLINQKCITQINNGEYFISYDKSKVGQKSKAQDLAKFQGNLEWAKDSVKELNEKLKELYQWELDREKAYWKSNKIWRTNPLHVKDLKEKIRMLGVEIKGELYSQIKQKERTEK